MVKFKYQAPYQVKQASQLKAFLAEVAANEGKLIGKMDYIFCSDEFLLAINREFLHHDFYTDIITFDYSNDQTISGEIYISLDRVKENSLTYQTLVRKELMRVIIHGLLHLVGYKDKTKSEITLMRQKEEDYLSLFEKS